MRREEIEKLLGGYATDSLTPNEREALFAAALDDQDLFDRLAREEPLRQALDDPVARARLLATLDEGRAPWPRRLAAWLGHPGGMAAMAGAAALLVAAGVYLNLRVPAPEPALTARMRRPETTPPLAAPPAAAIETRDTPAARPKRQPEPQTATVARQPVEPLPLRVEETAPRQKESVGVVGGVPGGVIGGIVSAPRGAEGRVALPPPPSPPPPAPAAPPPVAEAAAEAPPPSALARSARADKAVESPGALALFNSVARDSSLREEPKEAGAPAVSGLAGGGGGGARMPRAAQAKAAGSRPLAAATLPPVPHLGIRYTVLRQSSDGAFTEAGPGAALARGDRLRLSFEPNDAGHLYVLQRESGGGWRLLASDRVERRARYQAPRDGALSFEEPGTKQLYAIFSRTAEPAIAALDPQAIEAKLRASLPAQKSEVAGVGGARAVYVVNTSSLPQSQQVALAISLVIQ